MSTTEELNPQCDENCRRCGGAYCDKHFNDPCDCDVIDRHTPDVLASQPMRKIVGKPKQWPPRKRIATKPRGWIQQGKSKT